MTSEQIYEQLNEIFRDVFADDDIVLTPQMKAGDIKRWDSFNHLNIIVAIESQFGVKFKSAEIENQKNVGDLVRDIQSKLGG